MDTLLREATFKLNFASWKEVYAKMKEFALIGSNLFKQGWGNTTPDLSN